MNKCLTEPEIKESISLGGRCSNYDDDCKDVTDHFHCWRGNTSVINNKTYVCDVADGWCPFIHHNN